MTYYKLKKIRYTYDQKIVLFKIKIRMINYYKPKNHKKKEISKKILPSIFIIKKTARINESILNQKNLTTFFKKITLFYTFYTKYHKNLSL